MALTALLFFVGVGGAQAKSVTKTLAHGAKAVLVVTQPLKTQGEWVVKIRLSSDGEKLVRVRARRGSGTSFSVLDTTTPNGTDDCDGAAGTLHCDSITVPAVPAPGTWTFTASNVGTRPVSFSMTIKWHALANAG